MVVLVEVGRKAYLASLVPVMVNAILNEHQIVVDIVAFVNKGDFPRSRLGEKQRGKILAGWVTRKMRTMAQFAIRDMDPATAMAMGGEAGSPGGSGGIADDPRASGGSLRAGASSLRNVEHAPQILEQDEFEQQVEAMTSLPPPRPDAAEMPADYERPAHGRGTHPGMDGAGYNNGIMGYPSAPPLHIPNPSSQPSHGYDLPDFNQFGIDDTDPGPAPPPPPKPGSRGGAGAESSKPAAPRPMSGTSGHAPVLRLPGVDGREALDLWAKSQGQDNDDEEDWTAEAIMHMNLAGDLNRKPI